MRRFTAAARAAHRDRGSMDLKAGYNPSEIAEMTGFSRFQVHRILDKMGVAKPEKKGEMRLIYLTQLKTAAPDLFDSMVLRMQLISEGDD